jgi:hypothetical protein
MQQNTPLATVDSFLLRLRWPSKDVGIVPLIKPD